MTPIAATRLLWACVVASVIVAVGAFNGALMAAMLLVGRNAEINFAIWATVFVFAVTVLVICTVRLWKRYRYFS